MIIVISSTEQNYEKDIHFINSHFFPERLTIMLYRQEDKNTFPINFLRNLAIRSVQTSHFLILDMDLWPTGLLVEWSLISSECLPWDTETPQRSHRKQQERYHSTHVFLWSKEVFAVLHVFAVLRWIVLFFWSVF